MAYEFARARRYERPISMMALPWAGLPEDAVLLRFSDILAIDRRRETAYVMMPETDAPGAAGAVRRVRDAVADVRVGAATFPEDALTLQDLMEAAAGRISSAPSTAEAA
jgi:hypothetical protein